jgi:hypothetical protein
VAGTEHVVYIVFDYKLRSNCQIQPNLVSLAASFVEFHRSTLGGESQISVVYTHPSHPNFVFPIFHHM